MGPRQKQRRLYLSGKMLGTTIDHSFFFAAAAAASCLDKVNAVIADCRGRFGVSSTEAMEISSLLLFKFSSAGVLSSSSDDNTSRASDITVWTLFLLADFEVSSLAQANTSEDGALHSN